LPDQVARVTAVRGPVLDFVCEGDLPAINDAVIVDPEKSAVVCEVQAHLDTQHFRAIALQPTQGLSRLMNARLTGAPITVPVGDEVLGRLLNVVGDIGDGGPPLPEGTPRRSDPPPVAAPLPRSKTSRRSVLSGIKVIDLLAPLAQGGKAAMFGGAGVGKTVLVMELIRTIADRLQGPVGLRGRGRTLPRGARAAGST
jgi:F-type H+-transporting ATPase subunit beta